MPPFAIADAMEVRRRDLPVSIALLLFVGGVGAAVLNSGLAVAWAGAVSLLLIADLHLHRRIDAAGAPPRPAFMIGWTVSVAAVFAALPLALWIDGAPAAMAAALALWIVGLLRPFVSGFSPNATLALASAAPSAVGLLLAPTVVALAGGRADWDAAVIVSIAGAGVVAYVVRDGLNGFEARAHAVESESAISAMVAQLEDALGAQRVMFVDASGLIRAGGAPTRNIAGVTQWPAELWSEAIASLRDGQYFYRNAWEARPWRSSDGGFIGALLIEHGVRMEKFAPREPSIVVQTAKRA
jgi:hypothetical protein